jgi:hypothetical protein
MGRGKRNWERRAEEGAERRAEGKLAKAEKRMGIKKVSAESAANKLLSLSEKLDTSKMLAWLVDGVTDSPDSSRAAVCGAHLRLFEGCTVKRCRLPHPIVTIGHLHFVPGPSDACTEEFELSEPTVLVSVRPADYPRIRFMSVSGRCVFDWANPSLWQDYTLDLDSIKSADKVPAGAGLKLPEIAEGIETESEDDGESSSEEEATALARDASRPVAPRHECEQEASLLAVLATHPRALFGVFAALTLPEFARLQECSTDMRHALHSTRRYKELKSAADAEKARRRVEDKRKRHRQAFIGRDKKVDAYARGRIV